MKMNRTKLLLITLLSLIMLNLPAQDLSDYRWKNRLVLLLTESENDVEFVQQTQIFETEKAGLEERKLIIFSCQPNDALFKKYKQTNSPFEFVLIGLDGGEKLRQNSSLPVKTLYAIIDGMPMRRAEIQRKNE